MTSEEKKPVTDEPQKSSMEILSELFSTFDAEPPLIIKKEKDEETTKKHKKGKKKHKHKEKKHKKKDKKRKRDNSSSSDDSDLDVKIKKEIKIDVKTEKNGDKSPRENVESKDKTTLGKPKNKIVIKDLSTIFQPTIKEIQEKVKEKGEDGEIISDHSEEEPKEKHKKHKHKSKESSRKRRHSKSKERSKSREKRNKSDDLRHKLNDDKYKDKNKHKNHNRDRDFYKSKSYSEREKDRSRDRHKEHTSREFHRRLEDYRHKRERDEDFYKPRDRDRHRGHDDRDRERRHKERDKSSFKEDSSYIDKKKLLEIARRNAVAMMKSGSLPGALTLGPQAQEKVIAAIKSGGKTIEELTDFCKTLSKKEEMGDLSSLSEKESGSDSEIDKAFHHPFQLKDRPTSITMNIKNSVPLPIKSTQERSSELRMQFPVSSGQQHRKTVEEWVPVAPKKGSEAKTAATVDATVTTVAKVDVPPEPVVVPAPPNAPPGPQAFPTPVLEPSVDLGSIVSQRLTAMRRLQENPNDVQALTQIYKSNKEMQTWAQSKQQPGQFTGSTGAQILSQAELSSGYQAWAKKDQLQTAAPLSGGMGMHLLQKMGWKPGEGLGKEKTGTLEPLLLQVKLDKKGLVADEEQSKKKNKGKGGGGGGGGQTVKTLAGKHPVSLLGEYASKRKLGAPQYILCFECGPDHKKNFLFKVLLNGIEYKPNVASANKKDAKAAAASLCLQTIGLVIS
ncbi:unnamed protein product [Brassicogethes aeneus]|uniref:Protein SON n=1 Tax=Brassicogethes aeneus TaxID=1431903 RepID=A0A9P0AZW6_BRAAE|nr:unnamed protein product [Brassicogethes aeneus]